MLNHGFSEALIFIGTDSVLKMTPQAKSQSDAMIALGPNICPRIFRQTKEYYEMEKLRQPDSIDLFSVTTVRKVHELLKGIHAKSARQHDDSWMFLLKQFLETYKQEEAIKWLERLYGNRFHPTCLIHGDPTLANVMYRGEQMLLIDPVAPRGKIPSFKEVDYGKMMQSALGWESALWKLRWRSEYLVPHVLEKTEDKRLVWFWAMINIIRLLPRANSRPDIQKWVAEKTQVCLKELKCLTSM